MKRITNLVPNTITSLNLICGCVATVMAFHLGEEFLGISALYWFYIFVGAAAVFDFCDGFSARLLDSYSALGKELDSLCDLVSFGVAPGMLMLNIIQDFSQWPWLGFAALFIPVCGALRLAKFNIDDSQTTTFSGLPIPANAIFWIGYSDLIAKTGFHGTAITVAIVVLVSLSMVSPVRMFSLKFKNYSFADNIKRYGIMFATIAFVWIYGISGLMWTIIVYMLISLFTRNKEN